MVRFFLRSIYKMLELRYYINSEKMDPYEARNILK